MARLTKENWLDHGLQILATEGFVALKADVLAKSLRVSRGSFYHHFSDLAAYHAGLLDHWLTTSVHRVVQQLEAEARPPLERLDALIDRVSASTGGLEQAVRAWAFSVPRVREVLAAVDHTRAAYIASLMHEAGLSQANAHRAALVLYMSAVGYMFLGATLTENERTQVRRDLKAAVRTFVGGNHPHPLEG